MSKDNRDNYDKLFKTDERKSGEDQDFNTSVNLRLNESKTFKVTKRAMVEICNNLSKSSNEYHPETTYKILYDYISENEKLSRMLYSEISYYIFSLESEERGNFASNVEELLIFSLDTQNDFIRKADIESEKIDDCNKMIVKLYDHFQLALHQTENSKAVFSKGFFETKNDFSKAIKGFQKEYIAILSIFSAVVLAFSGGLTFSSSVLENVSEVSMYRLVFIALLIGFVLLNLFFGLFHYIRQILEIKNNYIPVIVLNIMFVFFMGLTFILWNCGVIEDRNERIPPEYPQQASESVNVDFNVSKN